MIREHGAQAARRSPRNAAPALSEYGADRGFSHAGVLRINYAQMSRWRVYSDNVRHYEAIRGTHGPLLVLDSRPYVEWLCEFGIFYTLTPL